ncbi:hypothetical protein [Paraburkholderia bannensis]|uniref:hypothetical protein n=1 Tax=Paraburkholderia bannensis TaxID=765414 RepID=UPI002AB74F4F|nr:hypothetical protein [Paraburkholderia bannensis]
MAYIIGQDVGAILDLFWSNAYSMFWIIGLATTFLSLTAASISLMRRAESFEVFVGATAGLIAGLAYFALALGTLPESDALAMRSTGSPTPRVDVHASPIVLSGEGQQGRCKTKQ